MSEQLIQFHFGTIGFEERANLEESLLSDRKMLSEYLSIKRDIELAEKLQEGPRPSPQIKERLRKEVRKNFPITWRTSLSFGAGAALAAGLVFYFLSQSPKQAERMEGVLIDSPETVSLNYL